VLDLATQGREGRGGVTKTQGIVEKKRGGWDSSGTLII